MKDWLDRQRNLLGLGGDRHTWDDAVGRWFQEWIDREVKTSVAKRYKVSLKQVRGHLTGKHLDDIDRKLLNEIVSARKKQGASNATIRRDLTAISSVLTACLHWGWLEENVTERYSRRLIRERRDPIVLPEDRHITIVAERCPGLMRELVYAAQFTGMRQNELVTLMRPQISLAVVMLYNTKSGRQRAVPLDERARGTFGGTPRHMSSEVVFWNEDGGIFKNLSSRFRAVVKEAVEEGAIPRAFRFHDLRHWHAVDFLRRGGSIYTLQQNLGHASIRTTEDYLAYLTPEEKERARNPGAHSGAQGATVHTLEKKTDVR